MMKWTQEQQDAAIQLVAPQGSDIQPGRIPESACGVSLVAFELACQRNELLDALKRILMEVAY
jgi:hypothetical protein